MIRVGLVGAGPWAQLFHGPMITESPDLELSAVWARRPEAAATVAAVHGGTPVSSVEELLAACDAVAFCVPPDVQAPIAVQAARAGKHLLLEKPLAFDVASAEAIARAADDAGVVTQLVLTNRYTEPVREFLDAVADPLAAHVEFVCASALDGSHFATPWRREPGAALFDLGPHAFDLLLAVAGDVTEVHAAHAGGVVTATTRHAGGAVGRVVLSVTTPGTDGPLTADVITASGRVVLDNPRRQTDPEIRRAVADAFVAAIAAGHAELDVHRGVVLQRLLADVQDALGG